MLHQSIAAHDAELRYEAKQFMKVLGTAIARFCVECGDRGWELVHAYYVGAGKDVTAAVELLKIHKPYNVQGEQRNDN